MDLLTAETNISSYKFPRNLRIVERNQTIEFRLPIFFPQRVLKLLNNETQFSNIIISKKIEKVYSINGGDSALRLKALLFILQNINWHGKPLFEPSWKVNRNINSIFKKNGKKSNYNNKNPNNFVYTPDLNVKTSTTNTPKNSINSINEVNDILSKYLNESIKDIDAKIYENINKFDEMINYITTNYFNDDIKVPIFRNICKIFSSDELVFSPNENRIASIYSIFFDTKNQIFKLSDMFNSTIVHFMLEKFDDFQPIFDFFYALISVSSNNADIMKNDVHLLQKITNHFPDLKEKVDDLILFVEERKQMDLESLEHSSAPTSNDLFFANKKIDNKYDKVWRYFIDYKKAMIDLTKLNFYYPFLTNLTKLKENTLDARDLYLYQNVTINFTPDTSYFEAFTDCTLFLKFNIRVPSNWTKGIQLPDWKRTERLAFRSLLILSTDPNLLKFDAVCKSCAVARGDDETSDLSIELLNHGIVPVTLISGEIKENKTYYMFEPTSSWSSIQPILQRLAKMSISAFPNGFIDIITKLNFSENSLPEKRVIPTNELYLNQRRIRSSINLNCPASNEWPSDNLTDEQKDSFLRVDHEQYDALRYSLNHNLTLVNGAPGTGKTHLAREILRILNKVEDMKPIAVISYTNHALDSILEDVIKFIDLDKVIRWGGVMRSENKDLKSRKWKNWYLGKEIKNQRDYIATKKHQLKNFYNLRQMASLYIKNISSDPYNLNHYIEIFSFLTIFIKNIFNIFEQKYQLPFNLTEIKYYNEYLKYKKPGIQLAFLPDYKDAVNCWLQGDDYYYNRNLRYLKIFNENQRIALGRPINRFQYLFEKEEEEENNEKDDDSIENNDKRTEKNEKEDTKNSHKSKSKDDKANEDEEEEEEEDENDSFDETLYGDEDMIEMIKNSYYDVQIGESFPSSYVQKYVRDKINILFSSPNSPKNMIQFLKEMSFPLTGMIKEYENQLQIEEARFNKAETASAGCYLRKMKLIGMTSTIASCRKEALEIAGCEIVIVEEAGELTESMLSCILPKTMKRLILIGDYQQLRPKVEYELTFSPYHYDISLFEKLVLNAKEQNSECLFTLSIQRRMHPQISELIRNSFYQEGNEKMLDDQSTNNLGIPFGIPYRVRFIMHDYEMEKSSGRSYSNKKEAQFCASLIPFFICRGYKPEDITIISLYKGQKYEIEKEIEKLFRNRKQFDEYDSMKNFDSFGNVKNPKKFKVVVLDNFQGEENKIIIVSLTRSDKPGFVKNRNRALVTLSRAREMLVVLGNKKIFGKDCKNNELWKKISTNASEISPFAMSTENSLGLAVNRCKIHKKSNNNTPVFLNTPEDVINYRFSYCKEKCNFLLSCGHRCQLLCHCHSNPPEPNEHDSYICQFRCEKRCKNNHQCEGKCGNCSRRGCPNCRVLIHHVFPKCHHEADIMCYLVTSGTAKCDAKCGKIIDRCGHACNLTCGHKGSCICTVKLNAVCPNCNLPFEYNCGAKPVCNKTCPHVLECGHKCSNCCSTCIREGHNQSCQQKCEFVFACGHHCTFKCGDKTPKHQHLMCHHLINVGNQKQECCVTIPSTSFKKHQCNVCQLNCSSLKSSLERCRCQCTKVCEKCGKRCRALTGEKCAFFCIHSELNNVEEPPDEAGPVFLFHGNHFLLVNEAIKEIKSIYRNMIHGIGSNPIPIRRLMCPINGCDCTDLCLIDSWLFELYNKKIEEVLSSINNHSTNLLKKELSLKTNPNDKKFHYIVCSKCKRIFISNTINKRICFSCGCSEDETPS